MTEKLHNYWTLWFHNSINDWTIKGYTKLLKITNIKEYLYFLNNYNLLGGINNNHFFFMRENIKPIWEDPLNKNGGCISIKVEINKIENTWDLLSSYIIGETIPDSLNINGISICIKNPNYSIIQIWLKKKNDNNINFINKIIDSNHIYKSYNI